MNSISFSLIPFTEIDYVIKITGGIHRDKSSNLFQIYYLLTGNIDKLEIPLLSPSPHRRDYLWENTCLEFFLGIENSPLYWEFNLAPSGDWNIYSFADYRRGMQTELAFTQLPFQVKSLCHQLELSLDLNIQPIIDIDTKIDIGITTVLKTLDGNISYWALNHPGKEADFHLRDGFIIHL